VKRIHWVDHVKAFSIAAIIFDHSGVAPDRFLQIAHAFNVPAFLIASGFLLKDRHLEEKFGAYAKRVALSLLPAYLLFALGGYLSWLFVLRHFGDDAANPTSAWKPFWAIFYGSGTSETEGLKPIQLWFLPCYFTTQILLYWIMRLRALWSRALVALALVWLGTYPLRDLILPLELESATVAVIFAWFGLEMRRAELIAKLSRFRWLSLAVLLPSGVAFALINPLSDLRSNQFGNPVLYILAATLLFLAAALMAEKIPSLKLTTLLARQAIIINPCHILVFSGIAGVYVFVFHLPLTVRYIPWVGTLDSMVNLAVSMVAALLVERFIPIVYGWNKKSKVVPTPLPQMETVRA